MGGIPQHTKDKDEFPMANPNLFSNSSANPFSNPSPNPITAADLYKKPEMPQMPHGMLQNVLRQMPPQPPAWQQPLSPLSPLSGGNVFDAMSGNNNSSAWHQYSR